MRFAFCIFKYFPYGGIQRDLMKFVNECQKRGHEVKIFCLRWQAPPAHGVEVEIVPIVGITHHAQYEHFADVVRQRVREDHFDLVVGFNKIPGLDVYYAGDSCFAEKAQQQRSPLYRLLPRYQSFYRAERAVFDQNGAHRGADALGRRYPLLPPTLSDGVIPLPSAPAGHRGGPGSRLPTHLRSGRRSAASSGSRTTICSSCFSAPASSRKVWTGRCWR